MSAVRGINELLQWLGILAIAYFLLGAYRLVGMRRADGGTDLISLNGPSVGSSVSKDLKHVLDRRIDHDRAARNGSSAPGPVALIFVGDHCPACAGLINRYVAGFEKDSVHYVYFIPITPTPSYVETLTSLGVATLTLAADQLADLRIVSTPLTIVIDDHGHVQDKELGVAGLRLLSTSSSYV